MTPRWAWAVFAYMVLWAVCVPSCAHRLTKSDNRWLKEAESIKWDATAEKHDEQQQQRDIAKKDSQAVYRRKTTPSPAGPIVEEEYALTLSELRDISAVATASDSRLATAGEAEKTKELENKLNVEADTKVSSFAWLWWVLFAVGCAAILYVPLKLWLRRHIPFL